MCAQVYHRMMCMWNQLMFYFVKSIGFHNCLLLSSILWNCFFLCYHVECNDSFCKIGVDPSS